MRSSGGKSASSASAITVLEIPPNIPVSVRFLAGYQGLITHWLQGRSHPCMGAHECPPAMHRARSTWRGYAPGEVWDATARLWFAGVVPVTEALEEVLRGRELRGEVWLLQRQQEGRKPGTVEGLYCERQPEQALSEPFDMLPVLLRFYHVSSLLLGVPNPMPAKIVREAVPGPAPNIPTELLPVAEVAASPEQVKRFRESLKNLGSQGKKPASGNGQAPSSNGQH